MTDPTCKDCRFFDPEAGPYGTCGKGWWVDAEDPACAAFESNRDPDHAYEAAKEDLL